VSDRTGLMSMTRRVATTVVSAFAAVFIVLFAWLWQESLGRDTGDVDKGLLATARSLVTGLDDMNSDDGAAATAVLFRSWQYTQEPGDDRPVHLALARHDGSGARHVGPLAGLDLSGVPDGASTREVAGVSWRLYTASGKHWKVALVDDAPARQRSIGWTLFLDLVRYLGLALPLVLVPVWFMAKASLKPLRQLSDHVAARSPLDNSPLPRSGRWKELAPLERALNQLFARTAAGLARDKAFVHDAAHELRTPLAVIATQAHVLAASEGPARGVARQRLDDAVTRASHLTQQLLLLARADSAARLQPVPLDLMDLARDTLALHAERAAQQGTELDLQGPDQLPLQSDPRALRSIIDNLLDNALRYGGAGGTLTVAVMQTPGSVLLSVTDQGPGIEPAHRERVFDRFWRGSGHSQPGSGLGLSIVREAARALGGDAHIADSTVGACFQVRLPTP
jgi:two-component system, OmpR family, sensor histidine kinase QseC